MSDDLYEFTRAQKKRDRNPEREYDPLYAFTRGSHAKGRDASRACRTASRPSAKAFGEDAAKTVAGGFLLAILAPIAWMVQVGARGAGFLMFGPDHPKRRRR